MPLSRSLNATEALRYYADSRNSVGSGLAYHLRKAKLHHGRDRTYHAKILINRSTNRENLLVFILSHADTLPTDSETIAVLRQDLEIMRSHIDTARWLIANPWA